MKARARQATAALLAEHRRHKTIVHAIVLITIAVSLFMEGPKPADLGFLVLSVLCELS